MTGIQILSVSWSTHGRTYRDAPLHHFLNMGDVLWIISSSPSIPTLRSHPATHPTAHLGWVPGKAVVSDMFDAPFLVLSATIYPWLLLQLQDRASLFCCLGHLLPSAWGLSPNELHAGVCSATLVYVQTANARELTPPGRFMTTGRPTSFSMSPENSPSQDPSRIKSQLTTAVTQLSATVTTSRIHP